MELYDPCKNYLIKFKYQSQESRNFKYMKIQFFFKKKKKSIVIFLQFTSTALLLYCRQIQLYSVHNQILLNHFKSLYFMSTKK